MNLVSSTTPSTPSRRIALARCISTVRELSFRAFAISGLLRPEATSSAT
jgi:hypothetical protein